MAKNQPFFTRATLNFLKELSKNNERDWFQANKSRYEKDVVEPALAFIEAMREPLQKISPHFNAIPKKVGGSLMRIYRDTRFSKDKAPYKKNIGIQFRHRSGSDVHAPGFYVHIEPKMYFVAAGTWHPEPNALKQIRESIDQSGSAWIKARTNAKFRKSFGLEGESLSRPPKGFDKDHPLIEDLKRKDHIAVKNVSEAEVIAGDFMSQTIAAFRDAKPYMKFLCESVGVGF